MIICKIFSTTLGVVIATVDPNRSGSLSGLTVLTCKRTRQCILGHALGRILQGGIIVRSISNLKRDTECVESLQVFEVTGKEGGLRNLSKLKQSWNK